MMAGSTSNPQRGNAGSKKRGLGRGLDALIEKAEPKPDEPVRTLPIDRLHPNRFQPRTRFDDAAIEDLAASIRIQGVIQPLVVTAEGDGYAIIAGERRWRAARKAGLEAVPVVVRQVADDRELLELALVENLQRSDLNPIEEAEAYAALQEKFGLSQEDVAARVGKARTTVTNSLRLLRLPDDVLDLLREGRLTAGQARPLLGLQDQEEQIRLADSATGSPPATSSAWPPLPGRSAPNPRSRTVRSRSIPPPPRNGSPAACRPGSRSCAGARVASVGSSASTSTRKRS
jgi:ParB family chromosome partitioning protein